MKKIACLLIFLIHTFLISSNKQSKLENPLHNQIVPEKKICYQQGNKQYYPIGKKKKDQYPKKTYRKKK